MKTLASGLKLLYRGLLSRAALEIDFQFAFVDQCVVQLGFGRLSIGHVSERNESKAFRFVGSRVSLHGNARNVLVRSEDSLELVFAHLDEAEFTFGPMLPT